MKRCLACDLRFPANAVRCPACGAAPETVDGFPAFAPELAHGGGGFKPAYFDDLARLEEANFWFRARNDLILWALGRYCEGYRSLLEIGCGTGYVLSGVSRRFPFVTLSGSEVFVAGLGFAHSRLPNVSFMQMDARRIPFYEEFDVVGAFDVLEHIEEDDRVLAQARDTLKPGGWLVLTVPQHSWLWSASDEYACHVRRYSARDLHGKLRAAGLEVVRSTSFITTLLPALTASRLLSRKTGEARFDPTAEFRIPRLLDSALYRLLQLEVVTIRAGIDLPVGGSRLVVARRM